MFSPTQLSFASFAAVQSLNSLNDQIAQFMVTRPCSLTDEDEAYISGEGGTLRKSMTLMRHLLVDAQVPPAAQWLFVPRLRLKCSGGRKMMLKTENSEVQIHRAGRVREEKSPFITETIDQVFAVPAPPLALSCSNTSYIGVCIF